MTTEKYEFIKQWQPILNKFVAPLFILSIIFLIVAIVLLIAKKRKNFAKIILALCPICFVLFYGILSISSDWQRSIMVHDAFFDGKGTPISEIADQYKEVVEDYTDKITQPDSENSNVTEPEFILISEYAEQIDENNDILVRYGTIENELIILGYCHFDGKDKKTEWKKIMAITALSISFKDCQTISCSINSGDEAGILINSQSKLNGSMLPESFRTLANEGMTEIETAEIAEYSQKIANALKLGNIE